MATNNHNKGFTLIEILVVISIIGLFASIAITSLSGVKTKAKDAKVQQEIDSIILALKAYEIEHGGYPNPGNGQPKGYCIGATDCLIAGWSASEQFPEDIAMKPIQYNRLASIFQSFPEGSVSLDQNNKGYIYVSCGGANNVCGTDEAYLVYPSFELNSMVGLRVGSFTVPDCDIISCLGDSSSYL